MAHVSPANDNTLGHHKKHTTSSLVKKPPQSVKFDVNLCCSSNHAGCNGHHHQHSTSTITNANTHTKEMPISSSNAISSTGQTASYLQNFIGKSNKTSSLLNKQRHSPPGLKLRKPILVNSKSAHLSAGVNYNYPCTNACQQCSKSIICCNTNHLDVSCKLKHPNCLINCLKDKILMRIFRNLNHSDLLQCRAVQIHWNDLISNDESFLDSTVFVANIPKSYNVITDTTLYNNDPLMLAYLPFRHGRLQYFDYYYYKDPQTFAIRNSDNEKYFPRSRFLTSLSSLELKNSYILWQTLKRILVKCVLLKNLIISNCHIAHSPNSTTDLTEFDEFTAGNVVSAVKGLEIYETKNLNNITKILEKFVGYSNGNLTTLKIAYYPPRRIVTDDMRLDCFDFCQKLKELLTLSAANLKVLNLDIQHEPTLDLIGCNLSKELEAFGSCAVLDLKEFQLSPTLGCWIHQPGDMPKCNVAMTMKSEKVVPKTMQLFATSFQGFLASQVNLKKLGLPCIEFPDVESSAFKSVLQRLPCASNLEELIIPCTGFLPQDFLHLFPNLRKVKVGCSCCGDTTPCWDIFNYYTGNQSHPTVSSPQTSEWKLSVVSAQLKITSKPQRPSRTMVTRNSKPSQQNLDRMKNIEELSLMAIESPENFTSLAKCLPNLTTLEMGSDLGEPVMKDDDLQACVKHLQKLRTLIIGCSENLTDYGITGIPEKHCHMMFKLQKYHARGINQNIWKSEKVTGRPLSDLKGLRKLVLMGSSQFTDIGIGYGLVFQDLVYCHLPYSDNITSWGVERFGSMNPSVESLVFSGINQMMNTAFTTLKRTHERVKRGDVSRSTYFMEQESPLVDDFSLTLPTPQQIIPDLVDYFSRLINAILPLAQRYPVEVNE